MTLGTHQPCSPEERGERKGRKRGGGALRGVGLGTGSPEEGKQKDKIGLDTAGLVHRIVTLLKSAMGHPLRYESRYAGSESQYTEYNFSVVLCSGTSDTGFVAESVPHWRFGRVRIKFFLAEANITKVLAGT